jgi:hypothetical protein
MPEPITDLLERAVDDLQARDDLASLVIGRVRRKRRLGAVAGAGVLVVVAVTGGLLLTGGAPSKSVIFAAPVPSASTAKPAAPAVTVLDSLDGVDVTYLPPGLIAHHNRIQEPLDGHEALSQTYQQPSTTPLANGVPHEITLIVQRGYAADLAALAAQSGYATQSVTVRGHPALLETGGPLNPGEGNRYVLTWVENSGLTLSLSSEAGVTAAEVMQTAAGLVVHAAPSGPADVPAATAAIQAAVHNVFTGGQPDATTLDSIADGQQLASTLAWLKAHASEIVSSARVTVSGVSFLDAQTALASINIEYVSGGQSLGWGQQTTVTLVDGQWKVSADSYCATVVTLVPSCPLR